ncbi:MAG: hypothetical protein DI538_27025, partial [Azospira oryzae]
PYAFEYYSTESNLSPNLPSKTNMGRDHWGYYNGRTNNSSLVPTFTPNSTGSIDQYYMGIQGNERDPSANNDAILFSLKSMKYPTGGRTEFEYETHDFDYSLSSYMDRSYYASLVETIEKQVNLTYNGQVFVEQPTATEIASKTIDISDAYGPNPVQLSAFFRFAQSQATCGSYPGALQFSLTKEDGTYISGGDAYAYLGATAMPMTTCEASGGQSYGVKFTNNYYLQPGRYIWRLTIAPSFTLLTDVQLKVTYRAVKTVQNITNSGNILTNAGFGGGIRIRRIKDFDGQGSTPSKLRKYTYHKTGTDGKIRSMGRRMNRPYYGYFEQRFQTGDCPTPNPDEKYMYWVLYRESDSNIPLNGSASGSTVGYDEVTVWNGENGEFGKTEYTFQNRSDEIWDYSENSTLQGTAARIQTKIPSLGSCPRGDNGQVLKEIVYEKRTSGFFPVKMVENSYTNLVSDVEGTMYGFEKRVIPHPNGVPMGMYSELDFKLYTYALSPIDRFELLSSNTFLYDKADGTKRLSEKRVNTYNTTTHLQLIKEEKVWAGQNDEVIEYTYPQDYAGSTASAAITEMIARNMHVFPITNYRSGFPQGSNPYLKAGTINKFALVNGSVPVLQEVAKYESIQPILKSTIPAYNPSTGAYPTYFRGLESTIYNLANRVASVQKTGDIQITYIWDYSNSRIISEVTNASLSNVAYTSFEADGLGNWTLSDATRNSAVSATGRVCKMNCVKE